LNILLKSLSQLPNIIIVIILSSPMECRISSAIYFQYEDHSLI